eukprot:jgi/Mesvir1/27815/Mv07495-RA.1
MDLPAPNHSEIQKETVAGPNMQNVASPAPMLQNVACPVPNLQKEVSPAPGPPNAATRGLPIIVNPSMHKLASPAPSLQKVASIPGVGGLIMASLPLTERLRLRGMCSSFQLAVDESLETLETISGEDVTCGGSGTSAATSAGTALREHSTGCGAGSQLPREDTGGCGGREDMTSGGSGTSAGGVLTDRTGRGSDRAGGQGLGNGSRGQGMDNGSCAGTRAVSREDMVTGGSSGAVHLENVAAGSSTIGGQGGAACLRERTSLHGPPFIEGQPRVVRGLAGGGFGRRKKAVDLEDACGCVRGISASGMDCPWPGSQGVATRDHLRLSPGPVSAALQGTALVEGFGSGKCCQTRHVGGCHARAAHSHSHSGSSLGSFPASPRLVGHAQHRRRVAADGIRSLVGDAHVASLDADDHAASLDGDAYMWALDDARKHMRLLEGSSMARLLDGSSTVQSLEGSIVRARHGSSNRRPSGWPSGSAPTGDAHGASGSLADGPKGSQARAPGAPASWGIASSHCITKGGAHGDALTAHDGLSAPSGLPAPCGLRAPSGLSAPSGGSMAMGRIPPTGPFASRHLSAPTEGTIAPTTWVIPAGNGNLGGGLNACSDEDGASAMAWLLDKCPNLKSLAAVTGQPLDLPLARRARPEGWWQSPAALTRVLRQVGDKCRRLRALDLERCGGVTDEGIIAVAAGCPELEHLNMACCNVTDASVSAIAARCARLKFLKVAGCAGVSDASITLLASRCPLLEYLEVSGCRAVTDASITLLARSCPNLRCLLLGKEGPGVTDASIEAVARGCPYLEYLDVAGSRGVTDRSITAVARECPRLRHLSVSHCLYVTDEGVTALAQGCPQLELLDVRRCIGVTDASIRAVGKNCRGLRQLSVGECKGVTDASVELVARNCPDLVHLDAAFCPGVTDYSVLVLARMCGPRWLEQVDLCRCEVTDNSMAWLAAYCPRLRHLDVSGCERVTVDGIRIVGGHCASLRYLFAGGCKGVLREEMDAWFPPGCRVHC